MKKLFLTSVLVLISTGIAIAQPSQGQGGAQAGVNGTTSTAPDNMRPDEGTTGLNDRATTQRPMQSERPQTAPADQSPGDRSNSNTK